MAAIVKSEECNGCKSCEEVCPTNAVKIQGDKAVVIADECIDCNACEDACTNHAITVEQQ